MTPTAGAAVSLTAAGDASDSAVVVGARYLIPLLGLGLVAAGVRLLSPCRTGAHRRRRTEGLTLIAVGALLVTAGLIALTAPD